MTEKEMQGVYVEFVQNRQWRKIMAFGVSMIF
jgi:hypothetical protein